MKYGVCTISIVPLRAEESHRSEMVSQLIFAESFEILRVSKEWTQIRTSYDGYVGWIQHGQFLILDDVDFFEYQRLEKKIVGFEGATYVVGDRRINLVHGTAVSPLFLYYPQDGKPTLTGDFLDLEQQDFHRDIQSLASQFRDVPYLWGGKSKFGIDCSGFTQLLFKSFGVALPRDAYQQAEEGEVVDFNAAIKPGDLAFFDNEAGKITHVGLMLDVDTIIHASSRVRIDRMDAEGIFNAELHTYSHQLRIIKRYV